MYDIVLTDLKWTPAHSEYEVPVLPGTFHNWEVAVSELLQAQ